MGNGWSPRVRTHYSLDFEDWRALECPSERWALMIPEPLTNGGDLSYEWFIVQSEVASDEGSPMMEDFWLRMAAQRGSVLAMMVLGELRAGIAHDDEALRWYRRVEFLLQDPRNDPGLEPAEREQMLADARTNAQIAIANGADSGAISPQDLGAQSLAAAGRAHTYCLRCGRAKVPTAPPGQCDDSVHLELRNFG
jgi:hypothetical protein